MYKDGGILMQIFFLLKKKSTSDHDADDHNGKPPPPTHIVWGGGIPPSAPGNGEGMGGDWKRDTFQTPPNIPLTPPHNVCGGEGGQRVFLGVK